MNKVIELTGGMSLQLDDLTWIQNNVQLLTSSLAESVSDTAFLLYGGVISVSDSGGSAPILNITEGALWNADEKEIYLIDSVSSSLASGTTLQTVLTLWEWDLQTTLSGSRTFANGATKTPLEANKAVLTATPTTWTGIDADLINAKDIQKANSNLDILNVNYQNPANFTLLYNDTLRSQYRKYDLSNGEHILRLYTPFGDNCHLTQIVPPSDVFDGYELTIEVRMHPSSTTGRGLAFYSGAASGNVTSNLNLQRITTISYNTSTLVLDRYTFDSNYVTFNTGGSLFTDIYEDSGLYDINTVLGGSFKMLLRWNATTSMWDEVSRTKHKS